MSLKRFALRCGTWLTLTSAAPLFAASISSFTPVAGSPGDPNFVVITGTGFAGTNLDVRFNGTRDFTAGATGADGTTIQAQVPVGATTGPISVKVDNGTTAFSQQDFVVIGPGPYISGFSPPTGGDGATVTITGAHLGSVTNVSFNGKTGVLSPPVSEFSIQAAAPAGVTSGPISARSPQGLFTTSSNFFAPPIITSFTPTSGRANTNVLVKGTNFLGTFAASFGGVFASNIIVLSNGGLQIKVPTNAVTGQLRVYTPAGSFPTSSNFVVQPTIFGFTPGFGPVGTSVTITGANFSVGTPSVRFNGVVAPTPTGVTFSELTTTVPAGATSGPITVTNSDGGAISTLNFYLPASITSFSPFKGAAGTVVTINGINFTNASAVAFNGTPATNFFVTNNTLIGVVVPAGFSSGPISITTPAGTTNSTSFFYGAPLITQFSPTHGLPGTLVTLTGSNFLGATNVQFNGLAVNLSPASNNTNLVVAVPEGATTGPLTIITPGGTNVTATNFVLDYTSDLLVTVTDTPDPVVVGSNLVYSILIANNGPFPAPTVMLTNFLPPSVSLRSAVTTQGSVGGSSTVIASLGTIASGNSATVTLTVGPQSSGFITNTSVVISGYTDPVPTNNTAITTTFVLPLPLLTIRTIQSTNLRISWPVVLTNYILQSKTNLAFTNLWLDVSNAPTISGNENVVIETNTSAARFYRLIK
jgi:hypothetical protein